MAQYYQSQSNKTNKLNYLVKITQKKMVDYCIGSCATFRSYCSTSNYTNIYPFLSHPNLMKRYLNHEMSKENCVWAIRRFVYQCNYIQRVDSTKEKTKS